MSTGSALPPAPTIDDAIVCFHRALIGNDPIVWTMLALDAISYVAESTDVALLDPAKVAKTSELMTFVAPRLSEHLNGSIAPYRIHFSLSAACWLLQPRVDVLVFDRKLHVSMFAADLKSILCRNQLNERGDPLARYTRARMAWSDPFPPSVAIH